MRIFDFFKIRKPKNNVKKFYTALEIKEMVLKEKRLPKVAKTTALNLNDYWWLHW